MVSMHLNVLDCQSAFFMQRDEQLQMSCTGLEVFKCLPHEDSDEESSYFCTLDFDNLSHVEWDNDDGLLNNQNYNLVVV